MSSTGHTERPAERVATWKQAVAAYQRPCKWRATWQLVNSIGAYLLTWVLMYFAVGISWWLTVPLAVIAAGLQVRIFIIFHDCGHGSFFNSRRANSFWGFVCGLMMYGGIFAAIVFEVSAVGPRFPFLFILGLFSEFRRGLYA